MHFGTSIKLSMSCLWSKFKSPKFSDTENVSVMHQSFETPSPMGSGIVGTIRAGGLTVMFGHQHCPLSL